MACVCAAIGVSLAGCSGLRAPDTGRRAIQPSKPTEAEQAQLDVAEQAVDAGNYDHALTIFQDVLAENPTVTTAYLGIGEIYVIKKDYGKAEPAYRRAARLEPRNFDAQFGHGLALQMLKRFVEAVRAYHRALTIAPDDPKANLNLATTYLQLNDAERAVVFAERAVQIDPANGAAQANLGAIYEELGRYAEAVDVYLAALELMGNRTPLMLNLINALAKERRYQEAVNTAEVLTRIDPSPNAFERLGWCHFKLRQYDRSMTAYREAVNLDPGHWPSLNGIGVNALNSWLLSKKRDEQAKQEAGRAFRRSLRVNSDQAKVVELLLQYNI
jgi:tetratricopeptide (TPR) repeat protein